MSNWVNISGSVQLHTGIYKFELDKNNKLKRDEDGYAIHFLPYPKEQITLGKVSSPPSKVINLEVNIDSYPIIKRKVDEYIYLLDSGEHDIIYYSILPLKRKGTSDWINNNVDNNYKIDSINEYYDSILCINDTIRWTDCSEIYKQLITFFNNLIKEDIFPRNGVISFNDIYPEKYTLYFKDEGVVVEIYNAEDNTRTYEYYKLYWNEEDMRPLQFLKKVDSKEEFYREEY